MLCRVVDLFLGHPVIHEEQDDLGDADAEGDGMDGFVLRGIVTESGTIPWKPLKVRNEPSGLSKTTQRAWPWKRSVSARSHCRH